MCFCFHFFRQAATIASNICLYTVTYFVIASLNNKQDGVERGSETIRKEDLVFFTVSLIVCFTRYFFIPFSLVCLLHCLLNWSHLCRRSRANSVVSMEH